MNKHRRRFLMVRMTDEELAELKEVHGRLPELSRSSVARAAMRVGLEAIRRKPALVISAAS